MEDLLKAGAYMLGTGTFVLRLSEHLEMWIQVFSAAKGREVHVEYREYGVYIDEEGRKVGTVTQVFKNHTTDLEV